MLSDEERKAIEYLKIEYEKLMKEDNILFPLYKSDAKRLIDIIEKQSKEIEKLINANDNLKKTKRIKNMEYVNQNYVSKDKIKAKILECRKILYSFEKELELKANKEKYIHKESMNCLLSQISILQSLLEKE